VQEVHPQGEWTECTVNMAIGDSSLQIPVLMDGLRFTSGAQVAVAGVIVADPQRQIAGYQGESSRVVVAGYIFDPARFEDAAVGAPAF
jgi:hypothetical protein